MALSDFIDYWGRKKYKHSLDDAANALIPHVYVINGGGGGGGGSPLAETLWTDDTNAFFIRVDNGTTIAWTDISGNSVSAPGIGARPAGLTDAIVDKASYQATAAGTGYSIGDFLDHFVTADPQSGVVIAHFWINITTEAKLASPPSAANITPVQANVAGGATAAKQDSQITQETAINTVLGAKGDATWDGSTAASGISIWRYIGTKLEAVRALLAGGVSSTDAGTAFVTVWGVTGAPVASADARTLTIVTDAPTNGQKLVVDDLIISVDTDMAVTFKEETSGTVIYGPWYLSAKSGPIQVTPRGKKKLPSANKRLQVVTSIAGNITVQAGYHSEA